MKKNDYIFILCVVLFFSPFFLSDFVLENYKMFNKEHGMIMSFIKFGILATLGESIGLRIKSGVYNKKGFGLLPRAIVWGFLGLFISLAFKVFSTGAPAFLAYLGLPDAVDAMKGGFSPLKLLSAFTISVTLNTIFAPVMMTFHKITDEHITMNGGTILGLFKPIKFEQIISSLNWKVQWNFVFKKTIPFFWIPAHTITFLLPAEYQILFAAILGIALGILLAIASILGKNK